MMNITKLFVLVLVPVLALFLSAGEAEARKKHERRTHHIKPPHSKQIKKPYRRLPPPSFSVPRGPLLTKEMLTRLDREGVTNHEIYLECMKADDPLALAFRFFDKERKSRSIVGSNERIAYELCVIDALGVERFENDSAINKAYGKTLFPVTNTLIGKHEGLPKERYVASTWTNEYLEALAKDMEDASREEMSNISFPMFTVSSIVRSMNQQKRQMNSPARCLFEGDLCSSHTTGSTFDITMKNYPPDKKKILFRLLDEDRKKGIIFWIYERKPGEHCHVFVFPPEFRIRFQEAETHK